MAAGAIGLSVSSDDPWVHAGQGPGCCLVRRLRLSQLGAGRSSALRQVTADQDGVTRPVMLVAFRRFGDNGAHHQRQAPALGSPPSLAAGLEIGPEIGSATPNILAGNRPRSCALLACRAGVH